MSRNKSHFILTFLLCLLFFSVNSTQAAEPIDHSMKGWEVYLWKENGKTFYSLLPGTNRMKSEKEILDAATSDSKILESRLKRIPAGAEFIFHGKEWNQQVPRNESQKIITLHQKLTGAAPALEDEYKIIPVKKEDSISLAKEDKEEPRQKDEIVIEIHSRSGIGGGSINAPQKGWGKKLILRFYLGGLESLNLAAGNISLYASVTTQGEILVSEEVGKQRKSLTEKDERYVKIITKKKGEEEVFEVEVPPALLKGETTLKLNWIDFFR